MVISRTPARGGQIARVVGRGLASIEAAKMVTATIMVNLVSLDTKVIPVR